MNALSLGKKKGLPQDTYSIAEDERAWLLKGFNPFLGKYTPNNVLTDQTKTKIEVLGKPIEIQGAMKKDFGLQLRQLAQALSAHELDVRIRVVDQEMHDEVIKRELAKNLAGPGDYVLVNYHRKTLGQKGGGHRSPSEPMMRRAIPF